MKITKIKIPASYFLDGALQEKVAVFTLGLGPCGKVVSHLGFTAKDARMIVTQRHTDGTQKLFYYREADLFGRVEVEGELNGSR